MNSEVKSLDKSKAIEVETLDSTITIQTAIEVAVISSKVYICNASIGARGGGRR